MPIEIHDSVYGQYFVRITSSNGKILASSETIKRKANAIKNANSIREQAKMAIVDKTKVRLKS